MNSSVCTHAHRPLPSSQMAPTTDVASSCHLLLPPLLYTHAPVSVVASPALSCAVTPSVSARDVANAWHSDAVGYRCSACAAEQICMGALVGCSVIS